MVVAAQAVTRTLVSPTLTLTAPPASWAMEPVENVRFRPATVTLCFCFIFGFDADTDNNGRCVADETGRSATRLMTARWLPKDGSSSRAGMRYCG